MISSGGMQIVLSGGKTSGATILAGGTEVLQAGAGASGAMSFIGSNGTLSLGGTALPSNVMSGFDANGATGDQVVLTGYSYALADSVTLGSGNTLTVNLDGKYLKMQFDAAQNYAGSHFAVQTNAAGQVVIVDTPSVGVLTHVISASAPVAPANGGWYGEVPHSAVVIAALPTLK